MINRHGQNLFCPFFMIKSKLKCCLISIANVYEGMEVSIRIF